MRDELRRDECAPWTGWRHRSRMTRSPWPTPASAYARPSTVRAPGSWSGSWNAKPIAGAGVVDARRREARAAVLQPADRPAGQDLRQLLHVLLRVAAVDAERVQLEQLARVVLVQPARVPSRRAAARRASSGRSTGSCRGRRASPDASPRPAPCPRTGRARAAGSPRARSCRPAAPPAPWRPWTRTGDSTRTRRAARRTAARS